MAKNIANLEEKCYLLIYGKPDYKANISKIIYNGEESKTINRTFSKLYEKSWIEETNSKPSSLPSDGRKLKGKYFRANVKPLFDNILRDLEDEDISLTPEEKKSLKQYLDGKSFRNLVYDITQKNGRLRNKNINFSTVKQHLSYLSTYMVFTENWFTTRAFRAQPLMSHMLFGKTHPIFTLGSPLCKKLTRLDSYTSSALYSSFEAVSDMIEGTFEPVLKNYMIKLDKHTMEEFIKKSKPAGSVQIPLDPDKPLAWKVCKKKKND